MKNYIIALPLCFLVMFQVVCGEYKRRSDLDSYTDKNKKILAHGEAIIYPSFEVKNQSITKVFESLSEGTILYSEKRTESGHRIGLSIIPIINPTESNPVISMKAEGKNFFELLDMICVLAGPEYFWSVKGAVVVYRNVDSKSKPIDPFSKPKPNQPEVATP